MSPKPAVSTQRRPQNVSSNHVAGLGVTSPRTAIVSTVDGERIGERRCPRDLDVSPGAERGGRASAARERHERRDLRQRSRRRADADLHAIARAEREPAARGDGEAALLTSRARPGSAAPGAVPSTSSAGQSRKRSCLMSAARWPGGSGEAPRDRQRDRREASGRTWATTNSGPIANSGCGCEARNTCAWPLTEWPRAPGSRGGRHAALAHLERLAQDATRREGGRMCGP